jgi:hypothetical protein
MSKNIWYDADTLLEEVLDTMPKDIQALFEDPAVVTENDMADYFAPVGEELHEEFDMDFPAMLQEYHENKCCPDSVTAARNLCGCGGSGYMPDVLREWLDSQED